MCNWSCGVKLHLTFLDRGHAPKKYACTCAYAGVCVCLFVVCVANLLNRTYMCMCQYGTRCQLRSSGGGREGGREERKVERREVFYTIQEGRLFRYLTPSLVKE